ncbi:MAG TPA: YbaK/EbsC family protein [bacterium]|jgi:Ala-tRNA(Pro) deacylase|nr:YbaK/EbsC family protein [bacterium]
MTSRERLEQYFKDNRVSFSVTPHVEVYTAQEVAAVEHVPGMYVAKVVIAVVDGTPTMLVLPAPFRVDIAKLTAALGAREATLATEDEFADLFPDCELGAMPPFGNLYNVPVVVDRHLTDDPKIVFRAGTHRETMTIAYADFERLVSPKVAEFAQPG